MKEFWKNADDSLLTKTELKDKRTLTSKTFDLGDGCFHFRECNSIVHYTKEGVLRDIDLNPKEMSDHWLIDIAAFTLTLPKREPSFTIDGITYRCIEDDCRVVEYNRWEGENYTIHLKINPSGLKTITELNSAKILRWEVIGDTPNLDIRGKDSAGNNIDVFKTFENGILTETFTGRVRKIVDTKTRKRELSNDVVYPVKMRG